MANNLIHLSKEIVEKCTECPLCRRECAFLEKYGNPKTIADRIDPLNVATLTLAYECSLCGLCEAVCPVDLRPRDLFLEMRREAVRRGQREFPNHRALLKYEKRGTSKRYTWYGLPRSCDTVLFPGCALPGSRPETVITLFSRLKQRKPDLGIVLDCCTKPSYDLGREDYFQAMFGEMRGYLVDRGVKTVLVACPNCYMIFKEFGQPLEVQTVYEILAEEQSNSQMDKPGAITIHDPCVTRFEAAVQEAVRTLIRKQGGTIEEMEHQGTKTLCCGEGGAAGFLAPDLAGAWGEKRKSESQGRRILTYCAGCVSHLNPLTPTHHVLDYFFEPEATSSGKVKAAKAPLTYWNRLRLKKRIRKMISPGFSRERVFRINLDF